MLQQLLDKGADPNARSASGNTALHTAAEDGLTMAARALLLRGANPNARNDDGETPLHRAAGAGREEVVTLLLTCGADINAAQRQPGEPGAFRPLDCAIMSGQNGVALQLLREGASIDRAGGGSSLMTAIDSRNKEMVAALVRRGADVRVAYGNTGWTPLHAAAEAGDSEIVRLLLTHGANPARRNRDGDTPLDIAMRAASRPYSDIASIEPTTQPYDKTIIDMLKAPTATRMEE